MNKLEARTLRKCALLQHLLKVLPKSRFNKSNANNYFNFPGTKDEHGKSPRKNNNTLASKDVFLYPHFINKFVMSTLVFVYKIAKVYDTLANAEPCLAGDISKLRRSQELV